MKEDDIHPAVVAFPFLLMIAGAGAAVWLYDWRWAVTGALVAFAFLAVAVVAAHVRHRRRSGGAS